MKRGPHQYEGGSSGFQPNNKRPRGDKFEARILIPSKVAGSVIGKGGANIQRLRTENDANIRIPDCPGPERVMTITTNDAESAIQVLQKSLPFMTEEAIQGTKAGGQGGSDGGGQVDIRLLIHQSVVGGIIGRAGFKIKEIRENSGASIKVYQTCAPQSTDRCVALQGTPEKVAAAAGEIYQIVSQTEPKGPSDVYDPINFDAFYAIEYGGFASEMDMSYCGGAPGGGAGPGMGPPQRGRGPGMRGNPRGGFAGGMDVGFRGGRGGGFAMGRGGGWAGGRGGGGGAPMMGSYGRGDYGGGHMPGYDAANFPDEGGESDSTRVTIPKDMAGAIIGPGGSRIRKIRNDSKATITIDEPVPGTNERIITITGTQRQIQTAQYLLQQSVRENAPGQYGAF